MAPVFVVKARFFSPILGIARIELKIAAHLHEHKN